MTNCTGGGSVLVVDLTETTTHYSHRDLDQTTETAYAEDAARQERAAHLDSLHRRRTQHIHSTPDVWSRP